MALTFGDNIHTKTFTPQEYLVEVLSSAKNKNVIISLGGLTNKVFVILNLIRELAFKIHRKYEKRKWTLLILEETEIDQYMFSIRHLTDLKPLLIKSVNDLDLINYEVIVTTENQCLEMFEKKYLDFDQLNLVIFNNCQKITVINSTYFKEAAATLRELIKKDAKEQLSIKLENDIRVGEVKIGNHHLYAKVVDLPTIIEGQKTIDNKTVYKTADICQMIICKENEDFLLSDEDDKTKVLKKKEPNKVDKKYLWPHGITPPLKNVRKRRFRKTLRKKYVEAPEIEKEVKYLLKSDSEALSVKWEVVSETEVQNNRKIKEEPFMQGEMHNDLKQNIERDIFGEALSDSDEEAGNINIMDMDEDMSHLTNDDSRFSDTNSLMEEKPSISGTQKLVTEFTKEMFISDDNSHHGIKMEDGIDSTFDPLHSAEPQTLSTLVPLKAGNVSADDIKHRIDQLQQEIEELKEHKKQQDLEIANIENINLRERFINLSNNLLTEQLEKEQQIQELQSYLL
ncbi:transcription initiation factor TFIID subunit 7-like isoform X2 [Aphis gossypii]|uniref:transcription initiation factor TFIID subunit 7-like isoform X2 n=1 Tax=Aphis gossypii TaxID=80765 RepID=UPI00215983FF|nr:transcription initiation factor TFIID subunit 7-like isoform X2 [Aphis gossypii]